MSFELPHSTLTPILGNDAPYDPKTETTPDFMNAKFEELKENDEAIARQINNEQQEISDMKDGTKDGSLQKQINILSDVTTIDFPFNAEYCGFSSAYSSKVTKRGSHVHLSVTFKRVDETTMLGTQNIGTLPIGYRPQKNVSENGYVGIPGGVEIYDGQVIVNVPNNTVYSVNIGFYV